MILFTRLKILGIKLKNPLSKRVDSLIGQKVTYQYYNQVIISNPLL